MSTIGRQVRELSVLLKSPEKYLHFEVAGLGVLVVLRRRWADVDHGRHSARREDPDARDVDDLGLALRLFLRSQPLQQQTPTIRICRN